MSSAEVREEWQALQSTYPDFVPTEQPQEGEAFELRVPVQLSGPLPLHIVSEDSGDVLESATISHLPAISLKLMLPQTYPSENPPTIHSVQPSFGWLPPALVEHLTQMLIDMWTNECILSAWVEHLHNGDQLLSSLHAFHADPKSIRLPNPSPMLLAPLLVAHNSEVVESRFRETTHNCPICLSRLPGTHCMALSPCSHVACRSCLGEFWGSCIAEGSPNRVGCPDPECVKSARLASLEDVKAVVSTDEVERWQWLLQKQEVERDPSITYCPIDSCQLPVRPPPPEDDQSPEWDRLRQCECGFAFCVYCHRAWHGVNNPCSQLTTASFVQTCLQYAEGSAERKALERRYGRSNIIGIIAKYQEEQANNKWLDDQTMACPGCRIRVQKIMGCNHMTCVKCRQHFCYRCGAKIEAAKPYAHFNTPGRPCYFKLFDALSQNEDHWVEGFEL